MNTMNTRSLLFEEYPDVVSTREVSRMLHLDVKTVYNLIHNKKLKCIHVDRRILVPKVYVFEYLQMLEDI